MTESTLTKNMGNRIRKRGGWARKTHGGPQGAGWPDLVCVYRGYPLWLEVKLPGKEKTLTKLQAQVLREAKAAGAIAMMVTTIAQVDAILDAIDRKKDGKKGGTHEHRTRAQRKGVPGPRSSRTAKRHREPVADA